MLTTVQFEISTTIRFKPNEAGAASGDGKSKMPKPEVKADVQVNETAARPSAATRPPAGDDRPRDAAAIESETRTRDAESF